MTSSDPLPPPRTGDETARLAIIGGAGVVLYVAGWLFAGLLRPGYDPLRQAISELFEVGAPQPSGLVMRLGLLTSGVALTLFAVALRRGLPGRPLAAPISSVIAGTFTLAVIAFPCTDGCPGAGTTFTDTMHSVTAGIGYLGLIFVPILAGWHLRSRDQRFSRVSLAIGLVGLAGFLVRYLAVDAFGGLQQRSFNTLIDVWYVLAAAYIVRRVRTPERAVT